MAYVGGFLNYSNWKPIKMEKVADRPTSQSIDSMKCFQSSQSMRLEGAKFKTWRMNHGARALSRRVLFFHFLAAFGMVLGSNPLLVDGLARAGEKRSYLLFGTNEISSDEVVMQGLPYTASIGRPTMRSLLLLKDDELEEILSVKLKLLRSKASAFRVFINLPDANEQTPVTCPEFSGSYFHEPRRVKSPDYEFQTTTFRIGISDIIKDLGLLDQPSIIVTFVPCGVDKRLPVVLERMGIELD